MFAPLSAVCVKRYMPVLVWSRPDTHWIMTCIGSKASLPSAGSMKPDPFPRSITLAPVSVWMCIRYEPCPKKHTHPLIPLHNYLGIHLWMCIRYWTLPPKHIHSSFLYSEHLGVCRRVDSCLPSVYTASKLNLLIPLHHHHGNLLCREVRPDVTLCGSQDIKISRLTKY